MITGAVRIRVLLLSCVGALLVLPATLATAPIGLARAGEPSGVAVLFAGFHQFADGRARIWVKLEGAVRVSEQRNKQTVTYVLHNSYVKLQNNKNPLIAKHFRSLVEKARLIERDGDTLLVVTMKRPAEPEHRAVKRPDGMFSVQVDFPPLR